MFLCGAFFNSQAQGFISTGGAGTKLITVDATGTSNIVNVGIGTVNSTNARLDVYAPSNLSVLFENLPNTTTSNVLYYDNATGAVTYGAAPSAAISSIDYDCGIGTVTITPAVGSPITSTLKAWLLTGNNVGTTGFLGSIDDYDLRFVTNNGSSCPSPSFDQTKQRMLITAGSSPGNVGIGMWDGLHYATSPQNKLLVQNGKIYDPYAAISGIISPNQIGILSASNDQSGTNVAGLDLVNYDGATLSIGHASIVNGNGSGTGTGTGNFGFRTSVSGDNSSNQGFYADIDGNGSANNSGNVLLVGQGSSTTGKNLGIQTTVSGSTSNNQGFNAQVDGSGSSAANTGAYLAVGQSSTTSAQNTGITALVSGSSSNNKGADIQVDGTGTHSSNIGMKLSVGLSSSTTLQNSGIYAAVSGSSINNVGLSGYAFGVSDANSGGFGVATGASIYNTGFGGTAYGNNVNNGGVIGNAYGSNSENVGATGRISLEGGSNTNSNCIGVYGIIEAGADGNKNYGVLGDLNRITILASGVPYYAIYGIAANAGAGSTISAPTYTSTAAYSYAGYFEGDVFCSNTYYYSDPKLKDNINEYKGALEKLRLLPVKNYTFKQSEFPSLNLPLGPQVGVLSTDLKKVFPNLVKPALHPADAKNKNSVAFEAVNYNGLIPILVEAIQELDGKTNSDTLTAKLQQQDSKIADQNNQITSLTKQIAELHSMLADICNNGCAGIINSNSAVQQQAVLYQSIPNPTSQITTIPYMINFPYSVAVIRVTDMSGRTLTEYNITTQGKGSVTFDADKVAGSSYNYSLIIDGKIYDTKTMVVAKN